MILPQAKAVRSYSKACPYNNYCEHGLKNAPLGMHHCSVCGAMVVAGLPTTKLCDWADPVRNPAYPGKFGFFFASDAISMPGTDASTGEVSVGRTWLLSRQLPTVLRLASSRGGYITWGRIVRQRALFENYYVRTRRAALLMKWIYPNQEREEKYEKFNSSRGR